MSHRRKSARPTNKLRRPTDASSSVSSDSDTEHNKMLLEDYGPPREELGLGEIPPVSPNPQLVMPPDLWQDFQALRAATNLDTASLMRRLIQDYGRAAQSTEGSQFLPCDSGSGMCLDNASEEISMEYQPLPSATADPDEFLILDLSSGAKATPDSMTTDSGYQGNECYENAGSEAPLDLTVCRERRLPQSSARDDYNEMRAPQAHRGHGDGIARSQSEVATFLFTSGPNGDFLPANFAAPQPRAAHAARPETAQSPGHKPANHQAKVTNHTSRSDQNSPCLQDEVHSLAVHRLPHNIPSRASPHTRTQTLAQGIDVGKCVGVLHSDLAKSLAVIQGDLSKTLSIQHGDFTKSVGVLQSDLTKAGGAAHGERGVQQQCVSFPVLSSSCPSILRHHLDAAESIPCGAGPMQLPTVTSLEFQPDISKDSSHTSAIDRGPSVYSVHMKLPNSTETTVVSLPSATTTQAIFLDPASGGFVAASGGLVSAVNIPLMTTANGGQIMAIPLLHALPEGLTAATIHNPAPTQAQRMVQAAGPGKSSGVSLYRMTTAANSTMTTTTTSKMTKPKLGRPRGQGKAQKAPPKDMKLVTENTLFPGVYTSILKLPWSKRARGKSSKAKNAATPAPVSKVEAAAACAASTDCVKSYAVAHSAAAHNSYSLTQNSHSAPEGETMGDNSRGITESGKPDNAVNVYPIVHAATGAVNSTGGRMHKGVNFLSMPVIVSDQPSPVTSSPSPISSTAVSSQSVMMVYPSGTVSTFGKPVRRRGRPPKLPMLSHLLAEKVPRLDDTVYQDEEKTDANSHPHAVSVSSASQHLPQPTLTTAASIKPAAMDTVAKSSGQDVGSVDGDGIARGMGEKLEGASLETRFNILANQLGLEIGSSYHASLVQATSSEQHATNATLYQEMLLSSRSLVEVKPRRRQLNDLIKPSDDCVYTSFRITPRNGGPGRRGGKTVSRTLAKKRAAQMQQEGAVRETSDTDATQFQQQQHDHDGGDLNPLAHAATGNINHAVNSNSSSPHKMGNKPSAMYDAENAMLNIKDFRGSTYDVKSASALFDVQRGCFIDKRRGGIAPGEEMEGSAVITERIPGGGEVPMARLYQDLYHCRLCNEMLPADDTVEHQCGEGVSPSLRTCDSCGTMFSDQDSSAVFSVLDGSGDGSGQALLCQRCLSQSAPHIRERFHPSPPSSAHSLNQNSSVHNFNPHVHAAASTVNSVSASMHKGTNDAAVHNPNQSSADAFACLPCGVQFVAIADYIEHRRSAHLDKMSRQPRKTYTLKTQVCPAPACPRLFHTQDELTRHMWDEHTHDMTGTERNNALSVTVASIKQEPLEDGQGLNSDNFERQQANVVEAGDTPSADEPKQQYSCTQDGCTSTFLEPILLLEHVQTSHEDVREWACPLSGCTRVFTAERHLRVHLLMHKDEKPLKCKFCNYRCRQKNALNWHMRKHPESAGHYRKFAGLSADA